MSIFDMFLNKQATQQAQPQAQNQQVQGQQPPVSSQAPNTNPKANEATAPNGVVPDSAATAAKAPVSPLEQYKDLWEPASIQQDEAIDPYAQLNPEDVAKAVAKADFSSALSQENLASIAAGGPEATKAFVASLNAVAQQVLAQSTLVSNRLMDQRIKAALDMQAKKIPGMVRQHSLAEASAQANPIFKNPAIKPIIEATREQLASKYPDATVAELSEMTNNYILAMGEAFSPKIAAPANPDDVDWSKFIS